jgi:hypothetical protein
MALRQQEPAVVYAVSPRQGGPCRSVVPGMLALPALVALLIFFDRLEGR